VTAGSNPDGNTLKGVATPRGSPAERASIAEGSDLFIPDLIRHAQALAREYANRPDASVDDFPTNRRQGSGE